MNGHVSPRLGVRFEMGDEGLRLIRPDGQPFQTFAEVARHAEQERQRAEQAAAVVEQLRQRLRALGHDPDA